MLISSGLALWFIILSGVLANNAASFDSDATQQSKRGDFDRNYTAEIVKIMINYLQVTGIAIFINVKWTKSVENAIRAADLLTSSGAEFFSFQCAFAPDPKFSRSVRQIAVNLFFPLAVIVFFMMAWGLLAFLRRRNLDYLKARWCSSVLSVMYIAYIEITRNVLRIFECTGADNLGPDDPEYALATSKYWVIDPDMECRMGPHLVLYFAAGIPFLIVVTLGMPAMLFAFLSYQGDNIGKGKCTTTYVFLYRSYRPGCQSWEVLIMARKALIAAIAVFAYTNGPGLQATMALGVLAGALSLHLWMKPFVTTGPKLNRLESLSLLSSFLTVFAGLVSNNKYASDRCEITVSTIVISTMVGVFVYMVTQLASEVLKRVKMAVTKCKSTVCRDTPTVPRLFKMFWCTLRFCISPNAMIEGDTNAALGLPTSERAGSHDPDQRDIENNIADSRTSFVNWEHVSRLAQRDDFRSTGH